jgi:hypothetical protein
MKIIPLHEKLDKLCWRSTGDVVRLQDGSGPYIVATTASAIPLKPGRDSGLFERGIESVLLVCLETGVTRTVHLSTRVTHFPNAELHLGKYDG